MKARWPAVVILIVYFIVGTLYASATPVWQAPDEPAHYNYVRSLATGKGFPKMEPGDYDQAYLSELTSRGFPSELSIEPLEYEDHQPPLYYLLAAPVYWVSNGSVLALRLFSVALGCGAVAMVMAIIYEFWPAQPWLAWFGGGLVAFVPQFVAITAAISNDVLVFGLLWLWLWLALRYLRGGAAPWGLGAVAGAVLLTKSTGYGVLPLTLLIAYLRYRRVGMSRSWLLHQLVALFAPALGLGGLWWIRNLTVYGGLDVMGLRQHAGVVIGQPRTFDWIADQGFVSFLRGAAWTVFRSFWGQFGWMGVVVDQRIYQGLAIFSVLTVYGALWRLAEALQNGLEPRQRDALILLGTAALITFVMFMGYNVMFVQHQGRYLFPMLPLLALGAALGWQRLLEPRMAVISAVIVAIVTVGVGLFGLAVGNIPKWLIAMLGVTVIGLPVLAFVPDRLRPILGAGGLLGAVALDLWCLFGFIVPMLS
jgi:hypothetical protein